MIRHRPLWIIILVIIILFYQKYVNDKAQRPPDQNNTSEVTGSADSSKKQAVIKQNTYGVTIIPKVKGATPIPDMVWENAFNGDKKTVFMVMLAGCPYSAKRIGNLNSVFNKYASVRENYVKNIKTVNGSFGMQCASADESCLVNIQKMNFWMTNCGDTVHFCIINPLTKEYVVGNSDSFLEAKTTLTKYAAW
ncbi:MAG: hypothetical protein LBI01_00500 [Elusimicrobium sp.]|jgi:hypothetical protein|nr:hypothetical protein [Elusimicrobium sp.]